MSLAEWRTGHLDRVMEDWDTFTIGGSALRGMLIRDASNELPVEGYQIAIRMATHRADAAGIAVGTSITSIGTIYGETLGAHTVRQVMREQGGTTLLLLTAGP